MKLNCFVMTDGAEVRPDGTLAIHRVIDQVTIAVSRRLMPGELAAVSIIPTISFVAMFEASLAEGLRHSFEIEFVDEDEEVIAPRGQLSDLVFTLNPFGRALRHNQIIRVEGLRVPSAGDYTAQLYVDNAVVATYTFYVTLIEPNG